VQHTHYVHEYPIHSQYNTSSKHLPLLLIGFGDCKSPMTLTTNPAFCHNENTRVVHAKLRLTRESRRFVVGHPPPSPRLPPSGPLESSLTWWYTVWGGFVPRAFISGAFVLGAFIPRDIRPRGIHPTGLSSLGAFVPRGFHPYGVSS